MVAFVLCTNSPWLIYSWLGPCTFHLAKHPMLDPHVPFNVQHLFPFLRISLLPSYQAVQTPSNTLCSSFITCSISSDFMGGLEYWPERRPCPNLALQGRKWRDRNKHVRKKEEKIFIPSKREVYYLLPLMKHHYLQLSEQLFPFYLVPHLTFKPMKWFLLPSH